MGFCLLNNIAIAAAHALERGCERVLILDWDVHHGNGTEEAFYQDPRVLFLSTHQAPWYPGSGQLRDLGAGEGRGFNLNVPLGAGADDAIFADFARSILAPLLAEFAPDFILVSAGYDAHARDPLGGMSLSGAAYANLTWTLRRHAERSKPAVPIVALLEGGYDLAAIESSVAATATALLTAPPTHVDALASTLVPSERHTAELALARKSFGEYWKL
jgi:acetoin utilization deacetylase AcuC-like enzyme